MTGAGVANDNSSHRQKDAIVRLSGLKRHGIDSTLAGFCIQ